MKLTLHKANERGKTKLDWLDSKHSFSFGEYYNPARNEFGALRVLNDDIIAAGKGFGMHDHANMEIITIVLSGEIEHQDSMGNKGTIETNNVQRMTAGTGILHSEMNKSKKPVHLLQLWIEPSKENLTPSYEQHAFDFKLNTFTLIASAVKKPKTALIHQDATLHIGNLTAKHTLELKTDPNKGTFAFLISGELKIEGQKLTPGDALAITDAKQLTFAALKASEVLVIQVPV